MISSITGAAVRPAAAPSVQAAEQDVRPAPSQASGPLRPVRDEYVPEEKRGESWGRYWLEKDADGSLKVRFDDPEAAEAAPEKGPAAPEEKAPEKAAPASGEGGEEPEAAVPGEEAPEKAAPSGGGRKAERCICNTDKVDRELEKLREKRAEVEKRLASETDEAKAGDLERRLAQVENELRQKDNDAYRRSHSVFTEG